MQILHSPLYGNGGGLVTKSRPTLVTSWTVVFQVPLSMELYQQEYWSGLPFPSPGDLPHPGTEPASPALVGGFFTTNATWEALQVICSALNPHRLIIPGPRHGRILFSQN